MAGRLCYTLLLAILFLSIGAVGAGRGKTLGGVHYEPLLNSDDESNPDVPDPSVPAQGDGDHSVTCDPPNTNAAESSTGQSSKSSKPAFFQRVKNFAKDVAHKADRMATVLLADAPPIAAMGTMTYVQGIGNCHTHYCTSTIVYVSYAPPGRAIGVTTAACLNTIKQIANADGKMESGEYAKLTHYPSLTRNDVSALRMQVHYSIGKPAAALPQENDFQQLNSSDVHVVDWYPGNSYTTSTSAKIVSTRDCWADATGQPEVGLFDASWLCVKISASSSFKSGAPLYYVKSRTENVFLGIYKGKAQATNHHIFFNMRRYTPLLTQLVASLRQ